ncbi:glycosyltransferase [Acidiphilium iwatense]|uniref:Glycosyltransferase n=1 Tax=Acidiphilium iwatense TaxID=768198 RepID=A0ABS9E5H5_9PROT|nr:glycosyltransferase [Acidiphilium iwatense]MCF3948824.1 glycosyltransferase [Acidiphilium iwatense]
MHIDARAERRIGLVSLRPRIAVIIPCHNEVATIAGVVADFQTALPDARIVVFDNRSTDATAARAEASGAELHREALRGKGHVVRRAFADIEADFYVLVDGDGTYDASAAPALIERMRAERLDMIVAARIAENDAAYRSFHRLGNRAITALVRALFGDRVSDLLSGYRVFSRRFVKSFPVLARGFEIETELTVHALELDLPIAERKLPYRPRRAGSESKLNTWADGLRIGRMILTLLRDQKPLAFFGAIGFVLAFAGLALAAPVVMTYLATGLVPRLPTAVLATGIELVAFSAFVCGLILDSVARGRKQAKRLAYLTIPAFGE